MTYNRILGLDIIRASAIILVLIGHLGQVGFLGNSYFCYLMGYYGVELFFVLSGFLIGQILIKEFSKGITWKSIRQFWIKRWLRTLPLYYLVLILRIIIDHDMHSLHFIFLQNAKIAPEYDVKWFGESWSLSIEEYFYLVFLLILFLFSKVFKNFSNNVFLTIMLVTISSISLRILMVYSNSQIDFENDIRKFTFIRLDSIAVGVFFAFIKVFALKFFNAMSHWATPIIVVSVIGIFNVKGNILVYDFVGTKLISSTIGIYINSILLASLIPFFDQIKSYDYTGRRKFMTSFIQFTALFSYCIYLIHLPIYHGIIRSSHIDYLWIAQVFLSLTIIYSLSALTFFYFERPILNLREKWVK